MITSGHENGYWWWTAYVSINGALPPQMWCFPSLKSLVVAAGNEKKDCHTSAEERVAFSSMAERLLRKQSRDETGGVVTSGSGSMVWAWWTTPAICGKKHGVPSRTYKSTQVVKCGYISKRHQASSTTTRTIIKHQLAIVVSLSIN